MLPVVWNTHIHRAASYYAYAWTDTLRQCKSADVQSYEQ